MAEKASLTYNSAEHELIAEGEWTLANLPLLQVSLNKIQPANTQQLTLNGEGISSFDSAGAWFVTRLQKKLAGKNTKVNFKDFAKQHQELLDIVEEKVGEETKIPETPVKPNFFARVGMNTINQLKELNQYLAFVGYLSYEALRIILIPTHIRFKQIAGIIYRTGFLALPIIALLSFMIGVVITFQMGLQLRNYGANIFIVDLLGLAVLREFGPLLTAIMIAGRTGSAFTAELGMMKLNQEIDALNTMGVTPAELLLLPRIIGLFIALPLLTIWSDIFGVLGGMVMANKMLSITWYDFLQRFPRVIPLKTLFIGLGKAPIFALLIASIGCYQGMQVSGGADSVGRNTTRSVVLAIFFIIVADALFSVMFSQLKL